MTDSALRLISKTGREALDIENDMLRILGLVDWVRAIASEPNMHPIRKAFQSERSRIISRTSEITRTAGELLAASEDCLGLEE